MKDCVLDLHDKRNRAIDALKEIDGDRICELFMNFHGMQLFSEDFIDFLIDEGVMEPFEEDDDE